VLVEELVEHGGPRAARLVRQPGWDGDLRGGLGRGRGRGERAGHDGDGRAPHRRTPPPKPAGRPCRINARARTAAASAGGAPAIMSRSTSRWSEANSAAESRAFS